MTYLLGKKHERAWNLSNELSDIEPKLAAYDWSDIYAGTKVELSHPVSIPSTFFLGVLKLVYGNKSIQQLIDATSDTLMMLAAIYGSEAHIKEELARHQVTVTVPEDFLRNLDIE